MDYWYKLVDTITYLMKPGRALLALKFQTNHLWTTLVIKHYGHLILGHWCPRYRLLRQTDGITDRQTDIYSVKCPSPFHGPRPFNGGGIKMVWGQLIGKSTPKISLGPILFGLWTCLHNNTGNEIFFGGKTNNLF